MFTSDDRVFSNAFPEFGVGKITRVREQKSKFASEKKFTFLTITWPSGATTVHVYPLPRGVTDWKFEVIKSSCLTL